MGTRPALPRHSLKRSPLSGLVSLPTLASTGHGTVGVVIMDTVAKCGIKVV